MSRILDTHFHLWDTRVGVYSWVESAIHDGVHFAEAGTLPPSYTATAYRSAWDGLGVVPFVHVEAGADARGTQQEWAWLRPALGKFGSDVRMVVPVDLRDVRSIDRALRMAEQPEVVGVREIVTFSDDTRRSFVQSDPLLDPDWLRGYDRVAGSSLVFDLQIYPGQVAGAVALARRHGSQRIILNHTLLPELGDPLEMKRWWTALERLAAEPNVAIKLGGLAMRNPRWAAGARVEAMLECVHAFGADRAMFGTNAPVELARASAEDVAASFRAVLDALSPAEQALVAEQAAQQWYGRRR